MIITNMNNYSYTDLWLLLEKRKYKDAIEFKEFLLKWDIKTDISLDIIKNKYINNKNEYFKEYLYKDENYEVILIIWTPYSETPIHNHVKGGCIMKVIEGRLKIIKYDDGDLSSIQYINSEYYNEGSIEYIRGKHGIHKVMNNKDRLAISLHIYVLSKNE